MLRRAALAASLLALFIVNTASAANGSFTITDNRYSVASQTVGLGDQVSWMTNGKQNHNHHTATGILTTGRGWGVMAWSFDYPIGSALSQAETFHQAGGWQFRCLIHSSMRGTVNVKFNSSSSAGPLGTTFVLTLGNQSLPSGFVHDIQKRKVGGSFSTWKSPSTSTQSWKPAKKGTFQFQTRVRNTSNGDTTLYSPVMSITVS